MLKTCVFCFYCKKDRKKPSTHSQIALTSPHPAQVYPRKSEIPVSWGHLAHQVLCISSQSNKNQLCGRAQRAGPTAILFIQQHW